MAPYLGSGDPKTHVKAFGAQMLIVEAFDAVRCKMFVGTLIGTTLQWFSRIPDGTVDSLQTFSQLSLTICSESGQAPKLADLFDIRQKEGESLWVSSTDSVRF